MAALWTDTARLFDGSYAKSPLSEWMLPSKTTPTMRASRSMTGEPELPPMMSFVDEKSSGVDRSSFGLASSQLFGSANGGRPVARSNAPANVVNGEIARSPSIQPFTWPYESRGVNVASGYRLVP